LSHVLEVYSGPYAIHLGKSSLIWIDRVPERAGSRIVAGETVFRIPLEPGTLGVEEVCVRLDRWDDSALLFCRHVQRVVFRVDKDVLRTRRLSWIESSPSEKVIQGQSVSVRRRHASAMD